MRRGRNLREYRSKHLRKKKILTLAERRKQAQDRLVNRKKSKVVIYGSPVETPVPRSDPEAKRRDKATMSAAAARRSSQPAQGRPRKPKRDFTNIPSAQPLDTNWQGQDQFAPSKHIKVCHVIESLGLGGAQTMMAELVGGLNKYYGENIVNTIVCLSRKKQKSRKLFASYGVETIWMPHGDFQKFLTTSETDVVLHHRIAVSKPLDQYLPSAVKYVLLNHTWNSLTRIREFMDCHAYISVCDFLHNKTRWNKNIHDSRRLVILNGIENDYIQPIESNPIAGTFKTGRCHRMISAKFRSDSLTWMNRKISNLIPGYHHHFIGTHKEARAAATKYDWLTYYGTISERNSKMGIIKQLDAYFYETFGDEGASIAVLEALASGVPVLTKSLGGTGEIVKDGLNGFICKDRIIFELRMKQLASGMFADMRENTIKDFEDRLHIKHTACKYVQLFEKLMD